MAVGTSSKIAIPARYHLTPYPIDRWQGANPAIEPHEILLVINTDGSLSIRVNKTDRDIPFSETVVLLDENEMAAVTEAYSNIKPYLDRAEKAAQNAEKSEKNAAASETSAGTYAENAETSKTAAAASETAAAKSATASSQSADRAADAASAANSAATASSTAAATAQECLTQIKEAGSIAADTLKQAQALSTASAGIRYYRDENGELCYEMIN
jgi:methyl-accepting chemotaxis protein